jgi:hypothetical protein
MKSGQSGEPLGDVGDGQLWMNHLLEDACPLDPWDLFSVFIIID